MRFPKRTGKGGRRGAKRRSGSVAAGLAPARRFPPILIGAVLLLVACVSQRFSVAQMHQENVELRAELERRNGLRDREEAKVAELLARGRIERVARERLALRPPVPGEQVFLAEWTVPAERGEGILGGAGRGFVRLLGLARGGDAVGKGAGGTR